MRPTRALVACVALAASFWTGRALASDTEVRPNAISYEPFALMSRGLVVQYERLIVPHWSVVAGIGARFAARDDFSSWTLVLKSEARFWPYGRERWSDTRGMVGSYVALAVSGSRTALEHRSSGRSLGAMWDIEESLRFGYRFVIFGFQEITPSVGISLVHEVDEGGRLAPTTRPSIAFGLSVGWMF